jgi:hypothetical protein
MSETILLNVFTIAFSSSLFSKIAVTFEPVMKFGCPSVIRISLTESFNKIVYFITEIPIFNH